MKIRLKLFALLSDYLPAGADKNAVQIEVDGQSTALDIIDRYHIPREMAHLVLLNGTYLKPEERAKAAAFKEGDTLSIWPPVAGG